MYAYDLVIVNENLPIGYSDCFIRHAPLNDNYLAPKRMRTQNLSLELLTWLVEITSFTLMVIRIVHLCNIYF